jgi:hypothetical protein
LYLAELFFCDDYDQPTVSGSSFDRHRILVPDETCENGTGKSNIKE